PPEHASRGQGFVRKGNFPPVIFPLRFKLALLASLLLVAAIGTISLIVLDQSAQALAAGAGKRAGVPAESIAKESEVTVARVLDKDGRVLASSVKDEPEVRERMTGKEKIARWPLGG